MNHHRLKPRISFFGVPLPASLFVAGCDPQIHTARLHVPPLARHLQLSTSSFVPGKLTSQLLNTRHLARSVGRLSLTLLVVLAAIASLSLTSHAQTPTLQGDPAHPPATHNWLETQLFFGLGPLGSHKNEHTWTLFLDHDVTPRFPSGLSVVDLNGQWQGLHDPRPSRIHSRLLLLVYPDTPENAANIDALRSAWKLRTGDQSVLKVTQPVDVSF